MTATATRLITRWASQTARVPAAFSPENARLDARNLPQLLTDIARSAAEVPFHNDTGEIDGDWRKVLLSDQSFVLALLATSEIDMRAKPLDMLLEEARRGGTPRENEVRLTELVEALLGFADDLDAWLAPADPGTTGEQSIRRRAEEMIERVLGPQLQRLVDHVAVIEEAELTYTFRREHWDVLRRPWRRAMLEGEARGVAEAVERAWADRMLSELPDAVERFVEEIRALGKRAADSFAASLRSGDHSAHPALVIAFAQMFGHARDLLNRIPEQWIDYYQRRLLHAVPAPAQPDRMLLALVPKPGTRPALPRGSLIPAGKGSNGRRITFATDTALVVTGGTLREARMWWPGGTVARCEPCPDGSLGDPVHGIAAPLAGTRIAAHAIFASPSLELHGGTRRITLELDLDGTAAVDGTRIAVSVSTGSGWLPVTADIASSTDLLRIACTLPPDFPPLAACPDGADAPLLPALRLTAAGTIDATIRDARLAIAVRNLPDIEVRTPAGPASAAAAAPFGTPPSPGGWLRIDHPVLAGPPLDRLVVRFDWAGLPPGEGGLASYYQGYVVDAQGQLFDWPPFDNVAFTVTLSAPVPGWDASHRVPLFAPASLGSAPPVAAAPSPDIFASEFEQAPPLMPERGPLAPASWFAASAGPATGDTLPDHVAVTLAAPTFGFGHALHAANVRYATEAIARGDAPRPARPGFLRRLLRAILTFPAKILRKIEGVEEAEPEAAEPAIVLLPNPPFQPLLSGIALDYAQAVPQETLVFYHAATLDPVVMLPLHGARLFPAAPETLALDLCFDGVRPGDVLALLVHVASTAAGSRPIWHYRAAANWQPLPSEALLVDDTQDFSTTGIVRLAIPGDAAELLSLRLCFGKAESPPPILAILPDAISATRLVDGSETAMPPVPADTVTRLAGLAEVIQPLDSAGGQPPESPTMQRARAAERVRHRARAVTAWDIERLVLSDFPEIARVRILTEGDPASEAPAAQITALILPAPGAGTTTPPKTTAQLRTAIADRIAGSASPFAKAAVVDPVYVNVDVAARLVLDDPDVESIQRALAIFVSPWAEPGLDLEDDADADHVRAAIACFLLALPQVRSIDRLDVTLTDLGPGWRVPLPGAITLTGVSALAAASW